MSKETKQLAVKVKDHTLIASELKCEVLFDRKITLTEEKAFAFLEMPTFEGERQVSQKHVQYLYDQYQTGRFMWEQAVVTTCHLADKQYRINGQHTCWMRVNISEKIEPQVKELVYRVKDMESLRALYCTIDRNKSRSAAHSFKALMVGTNTADGLWNGALGVLSRALIYWRFGDTKAARAMTAEDIAALTTETYSDLFKSVGMLYQALVDTFKPIGREGVMAAMFATMEAHPSKTQDFWGPMATGLNLTAKDDARYQLRRYLESHGRGRGIVASSEEQYRVCINAWNKWRKNQPVITLKTTEERVKPV